MSKIKPSKKAVNRVIIGLSKAVVVVLVLSMITASGAASYSKAPAAAEGGGVKTTMSIEASSGGEANIYVLSGGKLQKLSPEHGGTIWDRWTQATELEVTPDGDVITANASVIARYDSNGTKEWQTSYSIAEFTTMDVHRERVFIAGGDDANPRTYNITNGTKVASEYLENYHIYVVEGFGNAWYTYENYFDGHTVSWYNYEMSSHTGDIKAWDYADAMGDTKNYAWIEKTGGTLKAWDDNKDIHGTASISFDADDLSGFGTELFGVNNGSLHKWDEISGPSLEHKWTTDVWGDNDDMHVKTDAGKGQVLIANNYDVALLDNDGNLMWSRTFTSPVEDVGISDSEPVDYDITGQVIDANNNPIEGATIEVQTAFQTIAGASTNASGYYNVTGVEPGTYDITAWKSGYNTVTKTRDVNQDIVLDFLLQKSATNTLEGNVDDAYGNAIENATVRVLQNGNVVGAAKTDGVGFYSISGIPNGTYEVEAFKKGYQSTSLTLTIKNYTTQDFILQKGENLVRGYVRDTDGKGIGSVIVWVGDSGTTVTSITTDSDGYYEVLLDDGNYTFVYSKSGYQEVRLNKSVFSNMWLNVTMGELNLIIEAPSYMSHGSTASYTVYVDNGTDRWEVTGDPNLTLSSSNYNVLGIDTVNFELTATNNSSLNEVVLIRGNYNYSSDVDLYAEHEVTVANATVAQLPILPPWWRVNAVMGDSTMFALIIMIWSAVVGARWTTSFGGLGVGAVVGIIFWYAGYLSVGMMLLATFVAIFLGMNVAANIDYGVIQ